MSGGVNMRRPYLSNLAGDAVREMMPEAEPTRWWCLCTGALSCAFEASVSAACGMGILFALTRATAALESCYCFMGQSLRSQRARSCLQESDVGRAARERCKEKLDIPQRLGR